jgi:hypothetical protein
MSRSYLDLDEKRTLVFGYDRPFKTYYVQLWDRDFDPDFDFGAPAKAAGYHEMEKIEPLAGEYGPYPLGIAEFDRVLQEWGVSDDAREHCGKILAQIGTPL